MPKASEVEIGRMQDDLQALHRILRSLRDDVSLPLDVTQQMWQVQKAADDVTRWVSTRLMSSRVKIGDGPWLGPPPMTARQAARIGFHCRRTALRVEAVKERYE